MASISSPVESESPTSDPSKYSAQLPLVFVPREVGVNSSISSSFPATFGTAESTVVESRIRPSGRTLNASIVSPLVSSPTSIPLKYILNVPAVLGPSEVASKRTISCGVKAIPLRVTLALKDIRIVSASTKDIPIRSGLPAPTSEPSKNRLQFCPSKYRISSSAKETPPTVPLPANEAKKE